MTELESDDKVRSMIQDPQKKIPSDSPKCVAWMELAVGRARIRGFYVYSENDIASLMHMSTGKGGKIYTGLNVNAPQNSPSRNVQVIAQLEAQAASEINRRTMSESAKLRAAEKKLHDYYNRSAL